VEEEAGEAAVGAVRKEGAARGSASLKSDGFWSGGEALEGLAWGVGRGKGSRDGG